MVLFVGHISFGSLGRQEQPIARKVYPGHESGIFGLLVHNKGKEFVRMCIW